MQGCCNAAVFIIGTGVGGGIIANGQLVRGVHFTAGEYSFVNTNADEWENTEKTMACQCSTKYLLKWYRARKGLPALLYYATHFIKMQWLLSFCDVQLLNDNLCKMTSCGEGCFLLLW